MDSQVWGMEWKLTHKGTHGPNINAFLQGNVQLWTLKKLERKSLPQCDGNANMDMDMLNWDNYNYQ